VGQIDGKRQPEHIEPEEEARELDRLAARCREALGRGLPVTSAAGDRELQRLRERYSRFRDDRDDRSFITGGALLFSRLVTPRPWLHFMTSNHPREHGIWGSFWDQYGGGFSCLDSVLAGRVTSYRDASYVPTAPRASDHRRFYLREQIAGEGVSIRYLFPQPGRGEDLYDRFHCEQGLGTYRLAAERDRLAAELLVFIPVDDPLEVWRLLLANESGNERRVQLFVAVNWGLESYPGHYFDSRVVSQGVCLEELNTLVALNNDKKNRNPRTGFITSRSRFAGFDMSGEDFCGPGQSRLWPQAVEQGACRGSLGTQPYLGLVSALQFDLNLAPGEKKTLDFLLGVTEPEPEKARCHLSGLREKYFGPDGIEIELERLAESWRGLTGRHLARTGDDEVDRFFNVWSKYQAKSSLRLPLSLDMVGYRDTLQYMMGCNSFDPDFVAGHLLTTLAHQYPDGTALRQFAKFPGAPHDPRRYLDNCVWIADTVAGYVQETGDTGLLDREVGFFDAAAGRVDPGNSAPVYEHVRRSLEGLFGNRSRANGLCLIGHGDWNDSLDGVSENGEGMSVWLSMALVFASRRFRELALWRNDKNGLGLADRIITEMTEKINRTAWDGYHYVYAFLPDGEPVGSVENEEGRIHLNVNAWSLFSGVAENAGRVEAVLKAIKELETPLGHLLLHPPYTAKSRRVGRIADIVPGQFENGSIYTHGQSFLIYGLLAQGLAGRALAELKKVLPGGSLPDIATGPPHQLSNFTVGTSHEHFGRNLYSNFTGSVNWLRKSLDRMLGLLPGFDCLIVDPVAPSAWTSYEVVKMFRGCRVHATVANPDGEGSRVSSARLDGEALPLENGRVVLSQNLLSGRDHARLDVVLGR